jgi:hypothetical protein
MVLDMSRERLFQELHAAVSDPTQRFLSAAIIRELKRRGIAVPDADPHDAPAEQFAAGSPTLTPAAHRSATRRDLHEMTRHADPAVRSRALSLLATSDDPQVPALARERAIYDADPKVAEVASRILEEVVRR